MAKVPNAVEILLKI